MTSKAEMEETRRNNYTNIPQNRKTKKNEKHWMYQICKEEINEETRMW